MPDYLEAIEALWVVWVLSWVAAAPFSAPTAKRSGLTFLPLGVIVVGMLLLQRMFPGFRDSELWAPGEDAGWALFGVTVVGFLFAWWARLTLGRLWSGSITLKTGHHIVDTGPYGIVRHPIYTGLLLSAFASAAAFGRTTGFVIAAVLVVSFFIKASAEERFLSRELGAEAYAAYRARVPMLVPLGPK